MNCRLIQNIKHGCQYDAGGINALYLLDIDSFVAYEFAGDMLYDECFAQKIRVASDYVELDIVGESNFKETYDNGIYRQQLTTYIRSLEGQKLSQLLKVASGKYLVVFRTPQGRAFSFGADGGAGITFGQQTGQIGETSGYSITLSKNSLYPLLEVDVDEVNKSPRWVMDDGTWNGNGVWTRDDKWKTI